MCCDGAAEEETASLLKRHAATLSLGSVVAGSRDDVAARRRYPVWVEYGLFVLIGLSSWLLVNGIFTQLPVLFQLPGGQKLPSYLSLCIQAGNAAPLVYVAVMPRLSRQRAGAESTSMLALMAVGAFTAFFLAAAWRAASQHVAYGLLVGAFLSGLVGSMSVVLFFPFASLWGASYTSATATGMGLTSLIASAISIVQRPGHDHQLFSTSVYFSLIGCLQLLSLAALPFVLRIHAAPPDHDTDTAKDNESNDDDDDDGDYAIDTGASDEATSWRQLIALGHEPFLNQLVVNALYYFLKSIVNYSVRNYPHSDDVVFWLNIVAMLMDASGRFATTFVRVYRINVLSLLHTALWSLLVMASCLTRQPVFYPWGGWLIVAINGVYVFSYTFEDTSIYQAIPAVYVRRRPYLSHQLCRVTGVCNQAGAFAGALLSFFIVEFAPLFATP